MKRLIAIVAVGVALVGGPLDELSRLSGSWIRISTNNISVVRLLNCLIETMP